VDVSHGSIIRAFASVIRSLNYCKQRPVLPTQNRQWFMPMLPLLKPHNF